MRDIAKFANYYIGDVIWIRQGEGEYKATIVSLRMHYNERDNTGYCEYIIDRYYNSKKNVIKEEDIIRLAEAGFERQLLGK